MKAAAKEEANNTGKADDGDVRAVPPAAAVDSSHEVAARATGTACGSKAHSGCGGGGGGGRKGPCGAEEKNCTIGGGST